MKAKKNVMRYIKPGLLAGLFFMANSISAEPQPDWVEGDAGFYPNHQYMTATGSASNAELAKNRALANLSKIFETHIRETSITKSDTHVSIDNGEESYTKKQHLDQRIQLDTDKIINGARIAETWKDSTVFTYHSLAVLDRQQAGNNIRTEMQRLDSDTKAEMTRSQSHKDALFSMAALNSAVNLQKERRVLQRSLKVIDPQGKGSPSAWNLAELNGQLDNKLQSLAFAAEVDKDPIGNLQQLLKSAMGNAGFPAASGNSSYTLVASLDVQDLGFRQNWYWLRGKLSVKMVEPNGKIRGRKQWPLKVSALQHNDAESRLMTQVAKKLNGNLKAAILEFSTSTE